MKKRVYLGIDTSNYTTSVAIVGADGELVANLKRPLPVKSGERGLRQSDAVFAHIKNLPSLMDEAREILSECELLAVGVSERPRNIEGSYMPCFLSGVAAAKSLVAPVGVPLYGFSHQCGHVMAAIYSSGAVLPEGHPFAALHLSGGTSELLRVTRSDSGFDCELVGGTRDLNAGQVIDRVGVSLSLPFPCGPHLEAFARNYSGKIYKKRPSTDGTYMSLSGAENIAERLYADTADKAAVAAFVFDYVGAAVEAICRAYVEKYGDTPFVFAGGVMCNSIIKSRLAASFGEAYFAEPSMSADNAVGIAVLTRARHRKENGEE